MDVDVDFYWPVLVIGSELNAVRYASENKAHILFNRDPYIHSYQRACSESDSTIEQNWAETSYGLYNSGKCPFQNSISKIRVHRDKNLIKVYTRSEKKYTVQYKKLCIFDLENVYGLEDISREEIINYRVLDWFDVKTTGGIIPSEAIEDKQSLFVRKIVFFDSTRIDGTNAHKDILAESILNPDQLNNVNFTDTVSRFKVIGMLKEVGFVRPKIELWKRDVYPLKKITPKVEENIIFMGDE